VAKGRGAQYQILSQDYHPKMTLQQDHTSYLRQQGFDILTEGYGKNLDRPFSKPSHRTPSRQT
jgi:hypothetical protein